MFHAFTKLSSSSNVGSVAVIASRNPSLYPAFSDERLRQRMRDIDIDNTSSVAKYALINPTFMKVGLPIGLKVLFR